MPNRFLKNEARHHFYPEKESGFTLHLFRPKKGAGFTLIELLIAIFVLTVGILGAYLAIQKSITVIDYARSRLTAAYLAQEGVEIIRNIKDSNLLERRGDEATLWNKGLEDGNCEVDYSDARIANPGLQDCPGSCGFDDLRPLRVNGGLYSYSGTTETKFRRKVNIERIGDNILKIKLTVFWEGRGTIHEFLLQENLYNWL